METFTKILLLIWNVLFAILDHVGIYCFLTLWYNQMFEKLLKVNYFEWVITCFV